MLSKAWKSWEAAQKKLERAWKAKNAANDLLVASRRKPAAKASARSSCITETSESALARAEREYNDAEADEKTQRASFDSLRAELSELETARGTAEAEEAEWKRKREELRGEISTSKEAIRDVRAAEKGAGKARLVVEKQVSKVERTQQKIQDFKSSAIERLKTEEYVVDQVEQAYEHK